MSRNIEGAIGDKYEKFFPGDKSSRVEHGKKAEIQVGESFENFAIETEEGTFSTYSVRMSHREGYMLKSGYLK